MEDLSPEETRDLLAGEEVVHIGVLSEGVPYVSPVSYVIEDDEVMFRTGPGRRLTAILDSPEVCVEVTRFDSQTGDWASVIAWGEARIVDEEQRSAEVVARLLSKYRHVMGSPLSRSASVPLSEPVVVSVRLTKMSGRSSGPFLGVRTRPGRL